MSEVSYVQQMLDQLYPQLNTKGSGFYLPDVIKAGYDPYGPFDWPAFDVTGDSGGTAAQQICQDVGTQGGYNAIPTPKSVPSVTFQGVTLTGLSNIVAERPIASQPGANILITAPVSFLTDGAEIVLNVPAPTNGGTSGFTLVQSCCKTVDFTSCDGGPLLQTGRGSFNMTVSPDARPTASLVMEITDLAPNVLNLKVTTLTFSIEDVDKITFATDITTVPEQQRANWDKLAEEALNQTSTRNTIVGQINTTLNDPGRLDQFGAELTAKLDDYLKNNHMYPFSDSFASVV